MTAVSILFAVMIGVVIGAGIGMLPQQRPSGVAFIATAVGLILLRFLVALR